MDQPDNQPPPPLPQGTAFRCSQCGYDLTGSVIGGTCPECGWTIDPTPLRRANPTNGMALTSMILGIISLSMVPASCVICVTFPFVPICGTLAIVFGFVSHRQIRQTGQPGRGMALTGLICGSIATSMFVALLFSFGLSI